MKAVWSHWVVKGYIHQTKDVIARLWRRFIRNLLKRIVCLAERLPLTTFMRRSRNYCMCERSFGLQKHSKNCLHGLTHGMCKKAPLTGKVHRNNQNGDVSVVFAAFPLALSEKEIPYCGFKSFTLYICKCCHIDGIKDARDLVRTHAQVPQIWHYQKT